MANKVVGSRRHTKQRRQRQSLLAKNTDVRVNHQRHVAKAVVTTPETRKVVLEDTNASNMTPAGPTADTFVGKDKDTSSAVSVSTASSGWSRA